MTIKINFNKQNQQIEAHENGNLVYSPYAARIQSNGQRSDADIQAAFDAVKRDAPGTPFSFHDINQFEGHLNLFKTPEQP